MKLKKDQFTSLRIFMKIINKIKKIYKKYEEIINYVIVGALTTGVSIFSYFVFRFININYIISSIMSWICAVLFAFYTNKKYVFKSIQNKYRELIKFVSARIFTLLIEVLLMYLLVDIIYLNDKIAKILLQFVILILNYLFSKIFVFKKL